MSTLDTTVRFETPEGVELELQIAGPVARACAWATDLAIRAVVYLVVGVVMSLLGSLGTGVFLVVIFLLEWLYPVAFEVTRGDTPGKRAFGLMVCQDNGAPVTWSASMLRNLLRVVDLLPFLYGVGLVTMVSNARFQRLGDIAAGTLVVYGEKASELQSFSDTGSARLPLPLTLPEQRAILDFAERAKSLSDERQLELAGMMPSLIKRIKPVETLLAHANWLVRGDR
ncbi:MAG: RDD family protein [Pseudomonadota bacterium]